MKNEQKKCIENEQKTKPKTTLEARRFFLTIPKCEIGKEKIREMLLEKETYLSQYMIGEELHVDGTKHYHVYLKYSKKRNFSYSRFDYLGKHGKLEISRSPRGSYLYISKEDRAPLCNFDYQGGILSGKPEEIAKYLAQTGKSYSDLFIDDKLSIHELATKWRSIKSWEREYEEERQLAQAMKIKKGIKIIDEKLMKEVLNEKEYEIIEKDQNLRLIIDHINQMTQYKWNRPFKMKNLLIWSKKPNKGKTSLIRKIMEHCPMYGFPTDPWFHGYKSRTFWGILWNEMNLTGMDLEMLKNFLEGISVKLAIKGSQVVKEDNPQMFMTANKNLEMMIRKRYRNFAISEEAEIDLDALRARIDEVCVDDYENVFFLAKLIVPVET